MGGRRSWRGAWLAALAASLLAVGCGRIWFEARDGDTGTAVHDAGHADSGGNDGAAPAPAVLFAAIGTSLVVVDTETAEPTVLAPLESNLEYMTFHLDRLRAVAHATEGLVLKEIDPCTGALTTGPFIRAGEAAVPQVEGIAHLGSTGRLYAPVSLDAADSRSETLATIDWATGQIEAVGAIDGTADGNDLDRLTVVDGLLFGGDSTLAASGAGFDSHLYEIDPATGAVTARGVSEGEHVTELAYDRRAGVLYGWSIEGMYPSHLVRVDPDTGDLTDIGHTHAAMELGEAPLTAMTFAYPVCP